MKKVSFTNLPEPAKKLFLAPNHMTPNAIEYWHIGPYWVEIAWGKRILDPSKRLYGVTVHDGSKHRTDLGKAFESYKEALHYVEELERCHATCPNTRMCHTIRRNR